MTEEKIMEHELRQIEDWLDYVMVRGSRRHRLVKEIMRLARIGLLHEANREAVREYLAEWKKKHPDAELPGVIG